MALKTKKNNYYIKIDLEGYYKIYSSPLARKLEKNKKASTNIIAKYEELLYFLDLDAERRYYDPSYFIEYRNLKEEYSKYLSDLKTNTIGNKYPIIKKYFKEVEKSISGVIEAGRIRVKGNNLKEVYAYVKTKQYFGETEDC